jgi:hypothetical protein
MSADQSLKPKLLSPLTSHLAEEPLVFPVVLLRNQHTVQILTTRYE